jgi:RHS repeat-associated protein
MLILRAFRSVRWLMLVMCFCMLWLQIGPALSESVAYQRELDASRPKPVLPNILLHSHGPGQRAAVKAPQPTPPDVQVLSWKQMGQIRGRGLLRNPYFNGSLPWQRSFHDVNLCNGNLFKSYTDIQVSVAQGTGLVIQRTYNSNDATIGPFGTGWTHAYDIQMQEAADVAAQSGNNTTSDAINNVPRTDFFGGKHIYHRDADGLYTPPAYLYDEMSSDYGAFLVNGPLKVLDDTDISEDGTVKHYTNEVTNANGTSGNDRMCDYIQDRHGNRTVLAYNQSITQADGSTRNVLTSVTDPVGRSLVFTWSNVGTTAAPAWRITQVQGPLVGGEVVAGTTYIVTYDYYTDTTNPASCYNLKDVRLDSGGLNRITTYTYTSFTGTNSNGTSTETGLISTITDPLGHVTTYIWQLGYGENTSNTGTVVVSQLTEPGSNGLLTYQFNYDGAPSGLICWISQYISGLPYNVSMMGIQCDSLLRVIGCGIGILEPYGTEIKTYDTDNNLTEDFYANTVNKAYTYGQHGNELTQQFTGFPAQSATAYYNASQYFQKQSDTDMDGHTTTYGIGTDTAGNLGDTDPNIGDRGEVLWVQDAGYADPSSPSYGKEYFNTYNQYGQKLTGTDLNGMVTQNTYGAANDTVDGYYDLGNLVQVIQDPGTGHLNRTTSMHYDAAGRVIQSTDPLGQTTYFTYNTLGQPLTVHTPARGSSPVETISYNYEADGRTHSITDNRGMTVITYEDERYNNYTDYGGRVYSVSDPVTGTISYTYLLTGEKSTETLPSGVVWTYSYAPFAPPPTAQFVFVLPKDDPDSLMRRLVSIHDSQGRAVNVAQDAFGALGAMQYNIVNNSSGCAVALDETTDILDNGYQATGAPYYNSPDPSTFSRGNLAELSTASYQVNSSGTVIGQTLCSNNYTYDNASNRLMNAISIATTSAGGAVQYIGGAPTYGAVQHDYWFYSAVYANANDFNFTYAPVSNQIATTRTETYTYDDLNRLSTVNYGDGESQTYSFDSMGNRLARTDTVGSTTNTNSYSYDAANRLTGVSQNGGAAAPVTSDADGNTLSDSSGRTYTWDSQNRMASCTYQGQTTTFTYGSDGLRRSMTVGGITTYYAYDGTMLVQEFQRNVQTGLLNVTTTYMIGPMGPICRINETEQTEGYYPPGNSSTLLSRGVTRWYVYDGLGSVIAELDDNNNMTTSRQYDVYGAPRAGTLQGVAASSSQGYVGSLGHVTDQSTGGLIYMQARYYDPGIGRFVSEDPKGIGENWYEYCSDDPIDGTDSTGCTGGGIDCGPYDFFASLGSGLLAAAVLNYNESTAMAVRLAGWAVICYSCALAFDHYLTDWDNVAITGISGAVGLYMPEIAALVETCRLGAEATPVGAARTALYATAAYGAMVVAAMVDIDAGT